MEAYALNLSTHSMNCNPLLALLSLRLALTPPPDALFEQAKTLYAALAQWNTLEVSTKVDRAIVTRLLSRSGRILAGISSNMGITLLVEREKGVLRGRARTAEEAKEANRVLKQKVRLIHEFDGPTTPLFDNCLVLQSRFVVRPPCALTFSRSRSRAFTEYEGDGAVSATIGAGQRRWNNHPCSQSPRPQPCTTVFDAFATALRYARGEGRRRPGADGRF